ncbi:uncharacterized protein LOC130897305 isoform X2 [Diorhabda carinulata]|uniref:uncharacterized protein LOC130897305 isoform X2 n=1 Tax=Diorhabda carinulata TaxID=1163345 RepID=UPI0025A139A1|nr:uncharacterized protein LOC130897305 isoform X2 [Diorhabda carinulata]
MLRYFIKNLPGFSTRTAVSPHRYRSRLFRSVSPAIRYDSNRIEKEIVDQNISRSRSCTRSKSGQSLYDGCLSKLNGNQQRHVSQISEYQKKYGNGNRVENEKKYSRGPGEHDKSEYNEESHFDIKFQTGDKYELEAARPRQIDTQINIFEKMKKLEKENGEPATQYLQPRNMRPFGTKQIFSPVMLKTKRLHSITLPKIVKEKKTSAKCDKNKNDRRNYSTSSIFKQKYQTPFFLIHNLPLAGYNKCRILPKPKKFKLQNQTNSVSLEEKEANERIKKKLNSTSTNIFSDDLFNESLKKLQNFKPPTTETNKVTATKPPPCLKKKFFAQSNINIDVRMKSSFAANANPSNVTKSKSATFQIKPPFEKHLDIKQPPQIGKLHLKALTVNKNSKSLPKLPLITKLGKNVKLSPIEHPSKKDDKTVSSKKFQPKVIAIKKKIPIKSHISLNSEFSSNKSKIKKYSGLDKEKNKLKSSSSKKQDIEEKSQHGIIQHNSSSPKYGNIMKVTEKSSAFSHSNPIEMKNSSLFDKLKSKAKNKQSISNGRIERNRKTKIAKANVKNLEGITSNDFKLTNKQLTNKVNNINNTKTTKYTTPSSSPVLSVLNVPSINRLNTAKLFEMNEKKSNHSLCLQKREQNIRNIKHTTTHNTFDEQRDILIANEKELIEPIQDFKKNYVDSSTFKNNQEGCSTQPESPTFKSSKISTNEEALNQTNNLKTKISKTTVPVNNVNIPIQSKSTNDSVGDVEKKHHNFTYDIDSTETSKPKTEAKSLLTVHQETECADIKNNNNTNTSETVKQQTFTSVQSQECKKPKSMLCKPNVSQSSQNRRSKFQFLHENRNYEPKLVNKVTKPELQKKMTISKSGCQAYFESHNFKDIVNHIFPRSERSNQRWLKSTSIKPLEKINFQDTTKNEKSKSSWSNLPIATRNKSITKNSKNASKTEIILTTTDKKSGDKSKTDVNLTPNISEGKVVSDIKSFKSFSYNSQTVNNFSKKPLLEPVSREEFSKTNTHNIQQLTEAANNLLTHKTESDRKHIPQLHPKANIQESSTKVNNSVSKNTKQLSESAKKIMLHKYDAHSFLDTPLKESRQESQNGIQQLTEAVKKNMSHKSDNQTFLNSIPKGNRQESPPKIDTQDTKLTQLSTESISYKSEKLSPQKRESHSKIYNNDSQNNQQLTDYDNRTISQKTGEQSLSDSIPRREKRGLTLNKNVQNNQFEKSFKKAMSRKFDNYQHSESSRLEGKQELPSKVDIEKYKASKKLTADKQHVSNKLPKLNIEKPPPKSGTQETRVVNQLTEAAKKIIAYNNECQSFLEQPLSNEGQRKNSEPSTVIETSVSNKQHFLVQAPQGGAIRDLQHNIMISKNLPTLNNHNKSTYDCELQKVEDAQCTTSNTLTRAAKKITNYISEYQPLFIDSSKIEVNTDELSKQHRPTATPQQAPCQNSLKDGKDFSTNDQMSTCGSITKGPTPNSVIREFEEKIGHMSHHILQTTATISSSVPSEKLNPISESPKMLEPTEKDDFVNQKSKDESPKNCQQDVLLVSDSKISDEKNEANESLVKTEFPIANESNKNYPAALLHSDLTLEMYPHRENSYSSSKMDGFGKKLSLPTNCSLLKPEKTFLMRNIDKSQLSGTNDILQIKKLKTSLDSSPSIYKLGAIQESLVLNKLNEESMSLRGYNSCSKTTFDDINNHKKSLDQDCKNTYHSDDDCMSNVKYTKKPFPHQYFSNGVEKSEFSNDSKLETYVHRHNNNGLSCETAEYTSYLDELQAAKSNHLDFEKYNKNSNKITSISSPTYIVQSSLHSRMFSTASKNFATSKHLQKSKHIIRQKRMSSTTKTNSKAKCSENNAAIRRIGSLREKSSEIKFPYALLDDCITEDLAEGAEKVGEEMNYGVKTSCHQKTCQPQLLDKKEVYDEEHYTNNKEAPDQVENPVKQQNYSLDSNRCISLNTFTKRIGDIKNMCTYLPKQLFLVFGIQQRFLYNMACNPQEDDDASKLPVNANSERSYHFLCKKAERKLTPQSEFKSDFRNEFSELEEDGNSFTKIRNLQWRINNFHKWHRLNKLTNCPYNQMKRYYSSMTNVDVSQSFSTLPVLVPGKSSSYILTAYDKLLESKKLPRNLQFNDMLATTRGFKQQKQLVSTKSVTHRVDKKYSKYLTKYRKKSIKFAGSDECSYVDGKEKLLQPQYPILPELERVATNETLFPEPVNASVKVEYMRHKYGIPKTGVTLDCDSFQDAVASGQLKIKKASKPEIERNETMKQKMPQEGYCATAKKKDICDGSKKNTSLVGSCKPKCNKTEKVPQKSKSTNNCEKTAPPPKEKCKIEKTPSIWRRIIDYFKARPNCPPPDEWKKKAAREKAERYAKAAGLCLCEPGELKPKNCQMSAKSSVSNQTTKKTTGDKSECPKEKCKDLPRVITCPPPNKRSFSFVTTQNPSQGYSHHRSLSMSSVTPRNNRNKYHAAYSYETNPMNSVQRKYFSTTTEVKKSNKYNSDDLKESNQIDTLSTNSKQENIGDTFKEVSQNIIDAENENHDFTDENKSEGRNRHIDDLNKTLEDKEKQKLAESIVRSLLEVSINHQDIDNVESQSLEHSDQKHGNNQDDYSNSPYKFLTKKTNLSDIMFREPIDEYMKYCQAQSFANFIEGFYKMEVLSDVNYEDIEKIKTNKLINELNKLIIDKNQSKK